MSLVKPGKYAAHPERLCEEKFADVYESETSGNLVLCMAYRLDESGHVLKHWTALTVSGSPRQRTVEDLKERFGWDGVDPWWFETADLCNVPVELVIEDDPGKDGKVWSRIKYVNTPGRGSGSAYAPRNADRRALTAKYGSLFRAVAGPQPLKATAPAIPAAPKPKPPKAEPVPAAPESGPSDLNTCWAKLCAICQGESQDSITSHWFAIHEMACKGKTQDDFSPTDWGLVMDRILAMEKAQQAF